MKIVEYAIYCDSIMVMVLNKYNLKKRVLLAIILSMLVIIISAFFIITALITNQMAFSTPFRILHNPKITWAIPEAEIRKNENSKWSEVEIGQKLSSESYIRTGSSGNVDINFEEGTLIRITENTVAGISDLSLNRVKLSLEHGGIISKFRKITGNEIHKIITPTVVCGVRGTELIVESNESDTVVYGMSGVTEVSSVDYPDNPVLLGFQQKSITSDGQIPASPVDMTLEEIDRFRRLLDSMHSSEVFFVASRLNFKPDSAELVSESEVVLMKLSRIIKRKRLKLEIVGHTADVGDRTSQYDLSRKRAEAVKEVLVSMGVKEKRLATTGYGGSKPVADNNSAEGRTLNRRVEFLIK